MELKYLLFKVDKCKKVAFNVSIVHDRLMRYITVCSVCNVGTLTKHLYYYSAWVCCRVCTIHACLLIVVCLVSFFIIAVPSSFYCNMQNMPLQSQSNRHLICKQYFSFLQHSSSIFFFRVKDDTCWQQIEAQGLKRIPGCFQATCSLEPTTAEEYLCPCPSEHHAVWKCNALQKMVN